MNRVQKTELISLIVLIGFFCAVAFHYILGVYKIMPYPHNTFLCDPHSNAFSDFYPVLYAAKHWYPYELAPFSGGMYFPFNYVIYYFFSLLPDKAALITFLGIYVCGGFMLNAYYFKNNYLNDSISNKFTNFKNAFIITFLSYPMLFSFERANAESLIFIFTALFLFFYMKKNFLLSIIFIVMATAMKGYAGILIFLFVIDRRYKEALYAGLGVIFLTILSLLLFKGSISHQLTNLSISMAWFKHMFMESNISMMFNNSLYAVIEVIAYKMHHIPWEAVKTPNVYILEYSIFSSVMVLLVLANLYFFETVLWKKLAALTICTLIFPIISFDYHFLLIFLPLYAFISDKNVNSQKSSSKADWIYTIIFAILLIPKNYHIIYGIYNLNSCINTVIMTLLLVSIMVESIFHKCFSLATSDSTN